jgi:uncharacterized protein YjdB
MRSAHSAFVWSLLATLAAAAACSNDQSGPTHPGPKLRDAEIQIDVNADTLYAGDVQDLVVQAWESGDPSKPVDVSWRSTSPFVASVTAGGRVLAHQAGFAYIIATAGLSAADSVRLTVHEEIKTVEVTPSVVAVVVGGTVSFQGTPRDRNGAAVPAKVSFSVSDPLVATISTDGVLTGLAKGYVTVTAQAGNRRGFVGVNVDEASVSALRVSPPMASVGLGQSVQFTATVFGKDGEALPNRVAVWRSSNPAVATINGAGLLTATAAGQTTVTATVDNVTQWVNVVAYKSPVATVSLIPNATQLSSGQTTQIIAEARDGNGALMTGLPVSWSSSNNTVASVNSSGLVTALSEGQVRVQAIVGGVVGESFLTVGSPQVAYVRVSSATATLAVGQAQQLYASIEDQRGNKLWKAVVDWSTNNPAVATVTPEGVATGVSPGEARITAKAGGVLQSIDVTVVSAQIGSVIIKPSALSLKQGETGNLSAEVRDGQGNLLSSVPVTWASERVAVAQVDGAGRVTGMTEGSAEVVARAGGKSALAMVSVTGAAAGSVTVSLASSTLAAGLTTQASAVVRSSTGAVIEGATVGWSSSNPDVATVSATGLIKAIGGGSAQIHADYQSVRGSATISVSGSVALVGSVTVSTPVTTLAIGQGTQGAVTVLDASGQPLSGQSVAWSSSNTGVATVSKTGYITAAAAGSAVITATAGGKSGSATIDVVSGASSVASVSVSIYPGSSLAVGQDGEAMALVTDAAGNEIKGLPVTWTSSAPAVATVSSTGQIKSLVDGSATITASVSGKSGKATLIVGTGGSGGGTAPATVTSVTVTLGSPSLVVGQTTQATAVARDGSGKVITGKTATWAISSGTAIASVSTSGVVTALTAGSAAVRATIDGVSGAATLSVSSTSSTPPPPSGGNTVPAELPRTSLNFPYPSMTGTTIHVPAGGNLQQAINNAKPGDVITLAPGAVFTGQFTLPAKSGSGWVVIRTATPDAQLPAPGQRMTPTIAASVNLPKLMSPGSNLSPLVTAAGAHHYRLVGVEISAPTSVTSLTALVRLGDTSDQGSQAPSDLVLDRVYIHGHSTLDLRRCVALNSVRSAIVDSHLSDCHSAGFDSQAILGFNGLGPFHIENNYLEAAGEVIMFGGAIPGTYGLVPSDIVIRRNHIRKPAAWKGTNWSIKNLIEMKSARRVLIEGNVLDGNWLQAQTGYAILLKSSGSTSEAVVEDVTVQFNRITNSGAGVGISGLDGQATMFASRLTIVHNVMDNINVGIYTGAARLLQMGQGVRDIRFEHNTFVSTGSLVSAVLFTVLPPMDRLTFRNNIMSKGTWGVKGSSTGEGTNTFNTYAPGMTYGNNVFIGASSTSYPSSTFFESSYSSVGFTNPAAGDYRLASTSPYRGKASDGTDIGADAAAVAAKTAGVIVP